MRRFLVVVVVLASTSFLLIIGFFVISIRSFQKTGQYPIFHNTLYGTIAKLNKTPLEGLVTFGKDKPPSFFSHVRLDEEGLYQYALLARYNGEELKRIRGNGQEVKVTTEKGDTFVIFLTEDTQFFWNITDVRENIRFTGSDPFQYFYEEGNEWAEVPDGFKFLREGDFMNIFWKIDTGPKLALINSFTPSSLLLVEPVAKIFAFMPDKPSGERPFTIRQ